MAITESPARGPRLREVLSTVHAARWRRPRPEEVHPPPGSVHVFTPGARMELATGLDLDETGLDNEGYVLATHRTPEAVWRFLRDHVDLAAAEDRGDEELMMLRLDRATGPPPRPSDMSSAQIDEWWDEWYDVEPARTLTHLIERGLSRPWRDFGVFGLPATHPELMCMSVQFTLDGDVIYGYDTLTLRQANVWLPRLAEEVDADLGVVTDHVPGSRAKMEAIIATGYAHAVWRRE